MADSTQFTGLLNVKTDGAFATTEQAVTTAAAFTALSSSSSLLVISGSTATVKVKGIAAGISGQRITIVNLGTGNLTISHQNASATLAANRITTTTGADIATTGNGTADLVYSTAQAAWLLINLQA